MRKVITVAHVEQDQLAGKTAAIPALALHGIYSFD
jgi:hypothetical protein